MDRDAFLDHLRGRLAAAEDPFTAHPVPDGDGVPLTAWPDDPRPASIRFLAALEEHGGAGRSVDGPQGLREFVADIVERHGIRSAVITDEPAATSTYGQLEDLGLEVRRFDSASAADADFGVTGAVAAISRTGTVVVDAASAGGRSASLLPDVHLAVVTHDQLVDTPADFWRTVPRRYGESMPSQVVLITGPSKSADVEGVLTIGVHGPRAVYVALIASVVTER